MKFLALLQARTSSTRLPGKVLKPLLGTPMILRQLERLKRSRLIDRLEVVTSTDASDDALASVLAQADVSVYRGSLGDVLDRFYQAARRHRPEHVVRLTADCPLTDPTVIDAVLDFYLQGNFDYASNAIEATFPDGLDVEVFRFDCLEQAWREATLPSHREHVTPFINQQPASFRIGHYRQAQDLSALRWTVDEPRDFLLVERVYQALYPANPAFSTADVLGLIDREPELATLNTGIARNAGLAKSQTADQQWLAAKGNDLE